MKLKDKNKNLKLQTSLEFIIILACVSVLSLSAILLYGNLFSASRPVFREINSTAFSFGSNALLPVPAVQRPEVSAYMPLNATTNSDSMMQLDAYGCSNGTVQYNISSGSIAFTDWNFSVPVHGISITNDTFEPLYSGEDGAVLHYSINCSGGSASGALSLETYAPSSQPASGGNHSYYVTFYSRNESILYPLNDTNYINKFIQFNHCTYATLWGRILSPSSQCNHFSNAYDYMLFNSGCLAPYYSYMQTYCIVPSSSNFSIINGSSEKLSYKFSIGISTASGMLSAMFNNSNSSTVYLGGKAIGNATISSIFEENAGAQQPLEINGTEYSFASYSAYSNFEQESSVLFSMLSYYDNSEIGGSTSSSIQQSIYTYSRDAQSLEESSGQQSGHCSIAGKYYICKAPFPFVYSININTTYNLQNQTLYYDGSAVTINSR